MSFICRSFDPNSIFKKFKVLEFPISYVGLSTTLELNVEADLEKFAYLKTICEGHHMKFDDAREISAAHRAFQLNSKNSDTIEITFIPTNECITKQKKAKQFDNRFVFELRLLKIDGNKCCYNELHSEIGRYYISGQFEYCKINCVPKNVDFGDVTLNTKLKKYIRLQNTSSILGAKLQYVRVAGITVEPETFYIPPNMSTKLAVMIKPTCLKLKNKLNFKLNNPHADLKSKDDKNIISFVVDFKINVICSNKRKQIIFESLHIINELNSNYTYTEKELLIHKQRNQEALQYLKAGNVIYKKKPVLKISGVQKEMFVTGLSENTFTNFCHSLQEFPAPCDLILVKLTPMLINFGKVATSTYGKNSFTMSNDTKYDIIVDLLKDKTILYTEKKKITVRIKIKPYTRHDVTIFCLARIDGILSETFQYVINDKFYRSHPYTLDIGNPTLMVDGKSLKFGMITTESFITSVPIKIYNNFNVAVDFQWSELNLETPFEIVPNSGTVPHHSCRICDVQYVCKATKTKSHEVELLSISENIRRIPFELSVVTRKLSIKFLQAAISFKDIALNIETVEKVKLENSSREIALFHVIEPLIPGFKIEPMSGTIRPKSIMILNFIVKIPCVLEFNFDIHIKINNKENIILPVSGNVVEPKLLLHPKCINMARIPCHMNTFVPIIFQNLSNLKTYIEILDTNDDNISNVYILQGNERIRIYKLTIDKGQTKTLYIKVHDIFRREYEMFIPLRINSLLGPPNDNICSTDLHYYIEDHEKSYENNPKIKLKNVNKDIPYCKISGVITEPWVTFSVENFEINYKNNKENTINFSMKNISKYCLPVTILTSKLSPIFTLNLNTEDNQSIIDESHIKFELETGKQVNFIIKFHPKSHGRFVSTALLYLDKLMTIPYYNLTFVGKRKIPDMNPSTYRLVFPPSHVGQKNHKILFLNMEGRSSQDSFSCNSKEEPNLFVDIISSNIVLENNNDYTIVTVKISVSCQTAYARNITLNFQHCNGSGCEVEVCFCFTYCPLTLHTQAVLTADDNPYPYYPLSIQHVFFDYMELCNSFIEKWMFQQGFRRDLYPIIPDTFHAISSALTSQQSGAKIKGINVSYLNFVKRIAGPLMKHVRKITVLGVDESFKAVKEIHDTYREIITLLRSRGANLWVLEAKFLLNYDQFILYCDNFTPKYNADIIFTQSLLQDAYLFHRLNKQSWFDLILQSYKVFVIDSCFFECVCMSSQPKNILKILIDWYNENITLQHTKLRGKNKHLKNITNITEDLSDGVALISTILNYCPFMEDHFKLFCETENTFKEDAVINNACLIIDAMNLLRFYFPLSSRDLLNPNFLVMLFLSVHLYIVLPMLKPKDVIKFSPPLLRSSSRQIAICPSNQESLVFNYFVLNNTKNNFTVEKASSTENGKKIHLNVKYTANFVDKEKAILLVHGFNKTRIFDTYVVFLLQGEIGSVYPLRKTKVTGLLYRPNKVDVMVASPFSVTATYKLYLTDIEPTVPVKFNDNTHPQFYVRRLHLIDKYITLTGIPKESGQEIQEHKLYLQIVCLSTQIENSWLWFRSDIGEFFIRITTQPRWDLAIDTLQAKVYSWPLNPCSCGEDCECYRTTALLVPHRNDLMLKSLRYALLEQASDTMIEVFDQLIETATGRIILEMLLQEGGTNLSEVHHILRNEVTFRISSRSVLPRLDKITLTNHTEAFLALPITIPSQDKSERYSITLTSECGMDIRIYRIIFTESNSE